ncbi:MAG: D-alanyl-D-alanine carboxypeptidase [Alphaproteobacteria bacterium]|nr:D-alanyl-D-alanine carboxypeptidase [Alphaproteobacteria bacterium]
MKIKTIRTMSVLLFAGTLSAGAVLPARAQAMDTVAKEALLVDMNTGAVLLDKNADVEMPTSSMSKTVSLYLVFEALKSGQWKLTDELPVSKKAWQMGGSKMFIRVGDKVSVQDLIKGVTVDSGNDAVVCLAEGLAGSEQDFVVRMNALAKRLGMNHSHFMDATGLPLPGHYSTARDLATISEHIINDFPEYYHEFFNIKSFTYDKIHQENRDPLLGTFDGADGVKTGHTDIAGYGVIGSAIRNGRRLIMVLNGLPTWDSRVTESARLMQWGFRNFEDKKILTKDQEVGQAKVWLGQEETVPLVVDRDVTVTLPVDHDNDVKMSLSYQGPVEAPVRQGTVIGQLNIVIPGQPPQVINLVAGKDVRREGLFGRVASRLSYLLHKG